MGTLTGAPGDEPAVRGAVVNGVTLGEPAYDGDGNPLWDDGRIPTGTVAPAPVDLDAGMESMGAAAPVEDGADPPPAAPEPEPAPTVVVTVAEES